MAQLYNLTKFATTVIERKKTKLYFLNYVNISL